MDQNLQFSANSLTVLKKRYLKKDASGEVCESPKQMLERVAGAIAGIERRYGASRSVVQEVEDAFFNMMAELKFMPNSPTLMNAGKDLGQLSACFVVPVEDSMESIFDAIKATALIHKTGGGTGFSFSQLRPKRSMVKSTGGVASGPVSFMKVFDAATQAVKQGGTRRGANMGILRVDHPDIKEFITCKEKEGDISNFNISVAVTDEFMEKVARNESYSLVDPRTHEVVEEISAQEVFDMITQGAWKNGEPGVVFIDKINSGNPTSHLGAIESTNPCGEQPLLPFESCNLGSINLAKMLKVNAQGKYEVDWEELGRVTHLVTRFLDNVIDANKFPLPQIKENTTRTRKIGLGIMGWATMLGFLEVPYESEDALKLAKELMNFIHTQSKEESISLARDRGVFPSWRGSVWEEQGIKIRNATLTTIAPTGSISIIGGPTSTGIEPFFSLVYYRNILDGERLLEVEPSFEYVAKKRGFYSEELMKKIASGESIQKMPEIPDDIKLMFKTALEISPLMHVKMQAAFQEGTDNAVSKTINLPNSATLNDVKEALIYSYKLGCKGMTLYRDGSRSVQVLTVGNEKKTQQEQALSEDSSLRMAVVHPKPRPEMIMGTTTKITTGCGNLYITVNQDPDGEFFEVFTQMGKAGGCAASQLEAVGRLISLALRGGVDLKVVVEQLKGIRCPSPNWMNGKKIFSCADAIARVLEKRAADQKQLVNIKVSQAEEELALKVTSAAQTTVKVKKVSRLKNVVGVCPDCGSALRHQEGCLLCDACGYSKC
ncbi:MAG: vitamin B12-dependent ribonucleotide reductase [Candidatus Omnitrophica bacterium]|nr:vitamin B12-dependent ribonucleotide reductase [Candidatus Omnitrophota bacterium]